MTIADLMLHARAAATRLRAWAYRRARERSTWAGLSMLAAALGREALAAQISHFGDAIVVLAGVGGTAIAAATTSQHAPAAQP